jgi:hypothetical protein
MELQKNSLPTDYHQTILEIKNNINSARLKSLRAVNTKNEIHL